VVLRGARDDAAAYDFAVGLPDPDLFPLTAWRSLVSRELTIGSALLRGYRAPGGSLPFREAVARHIGVARSVRAGADDVLATSGAQQAFDLIGRVLISPGDVVAVEEPGYPPVRSLFESLGAKVVGVEVDGEGIRVDRIPARARIVYTTPSHQFPTGVRSSLARRTALLEWAEARGGVIIEDDYDSEFRFEDRPVDPLQSLDRAGRVIYVGTFSKSLLPGLRIGFLVAPQSIMPALREARQLSDWHGDVVTQAALARLIDTGAFAAHVRRANRVYAIRRASILDTVSAELSGLVSIVPSVAGLHIAVEFASGSGLDGFRVRDAATADGVAVQALEAFAAVSADSTRGRTRPGLVLGFGLIPDQHIAAGVHRLARVIRRLAIARA
jgi:GntR family transcriptional regulator/MocR family aminotransferase